jgi:hypothetical protein
LVFFILLSIGLGVWGYLGQKKAGEMTKKAEEAKKTSDTDKQLADYYKLQALWARSAAGYELTKEEVNHLSALLSDEKKFSGNTNFAAVEKMIATDKKDLGWDDKAKALAKSYRKEFERLKRDNTDQAAEVSRKNDQLKAADAREQTRDRKNSEFLTKLQEKSDELNEQAREAARKANARVETAGKAKREAEEARANDVKRLTEQIEELTQKHEKAIKQREEEIAALQKKRQEMLAKQNEEKAAKIDLLTYESPRGKIVRVDSTGRMPFINLGTADRAKEQLTFSIFGTDPNGKASKEPKGTLEIVKVIGPHLSQARVTGVRDRGGNPVQEGDKLYNPAWDPDHKIHIALGGLADFTDDGFTTKSESERNLREFLNYLDTQNVAVDAYVDVSDGKIKGKGVSLDTDYFVLGTTRPIDAKEYVAASDEKEKLQQNIAESVLKLRKQANDKGVTVVPIRKFAALTGYRIPRGTRRAAPLHGGGVFGAKKRAVEPKKKKDEETGEDEGKKDDAGKKEGEDEMKEDRKGEKKKDDEEKGDKKKEDEEKDKEKEKE